MKRILLAGVLAGLAMYIWSSVAHIALPLGTVGLQQIPNEQAVLTSMSGSLSQSGLYFFPFMLPGTSMQQQVEKLKTSPSGLLIYHPAGAPGMTMAMLGTELLTEIVVSILAVWLLSKTRIASFGGRVGFVTVVGLTAAIMTNVQYWNWYGFPLSYTASYMFTQLVGFLVAGLVAAKMINTGEAAMARGA